MQLEFRGTHSLVNSNGKGSTSFIFVRRRSACLRDGKSLEGDFGCHVDCGGEILGAKS